MTHEGPGADAPREGLHGLTDLHCHLDFAADPAAWARAARDAGVGCLSATVDPRDYLRARELLGGFGNVRVGAGLHPWWVADGTCTRREVALAAELAAGAPIVAEIGLDFAPRREGTFDAQLAAFDAVCRACEGGGKVLSLHAVRSADVLLDVLQRHGLTRSCTCVLHWFSGSGPELARAAGLGCRFSVGTRMLATRRGRAYVRQLPPRLLLLETDLPNERGDGGGPAPWLDDLARAHALLAAAAGPQAAEAARANGRDLLGGPGPR